MPLSTSVKWFHSNMPGAPVLNASAGSLVGVLDACLINGWGLVSASSLVVADGVATMTFATGHSFTAHTVALVDGATPAELNGEKRVLSITANAITFEAPGVLNGAATGAITAKLAPAGWGIAFQDTNRRAYRAALGNRHYLQVDDTNTVTGWNTGSNAAATKIRACEGMTGIATVENVFLDSWWLKYDSTAGTAARPWFIVADDRLVYVITSPIGSDPSRGSAGCFGETVTFKPGDAYHTIAVGGDFSGSTSSPSTATQLSFMRYALLGALWSSGHKALARPYHQILSQAPVTMFGSGLSDRLGFGGAAYPNAADNALVVSDVWLLESGSIRGLMPGLLQLLHTRPISDFQLIDAGAVRPGRRLVGMSALTYTSGANTLQSGQALFDVTGPWR
ncbi:MAG: hypothetical protein ROZ37_01610 [Aromatoleum sp.]|jgi:hypothetical protein|uniref:hypothetical protein n=1 Tax=Aromatoleum sp. TaxID=2307007 RepID=UPI002894E264|nr:hypothetical protein [Aromatoleum sp.]MDT3669011.1 hypothetical protein [Aromatoleum sp.]